jgi:ACR3 family arsenite efflux pump ArsB
VRTVVTPSRARDTVADVFETREAIVGLIVAVLPGVVYTIAYEREVGRWGVGISDRILRFVASSALFQVVYALPIYSIWASHVAPRFGSWRGLMDAVRAGNAVPIWLFLLPIGYLGIPFALGTLAAVGVRYRSKSAWAAAPSRA